MVHRPFVQLVEVPLTELPIAEVNSDTLARLLPLPPDLADAGPIATLAHLPVSVMQYLHSPSTTGGTYVFGPMLISGSGAFPQGSTSEATSVTFPDAEGAVKVNDGVSVSDVDGAVEVTGEASVSVEEGAVRANGGASLSVSDVTGSKSSRRGFGDRREEFSETGSRRRS